MRVSDYIAEFLVNHGITQLFTVTGGGAMFLNDSFGRREGLHVLYNHHEQACSIGAEGYARETGKPAAVCVTTGPGGTNALTGVYGAWVDSIPMVVISGQVKYTTTIASTNLPLRQLGDQEFNIVDCAKTMTKYTVMVTDPTTIRYHLEKAFHLAISGRPGPVWLDIPINVQSASIDPDALEGFTPPVSAVPKTDAAQLHALIQGLTTAKRPAILAGEGIRISGTQSAFLQLVERLKIPVLTAWNAHDLLADDSLYACGRPGTVGTRGGNIVLQDCDFLLSLGCRMNIRQISYNWENFAKNATLAAVDIDRAELDKPTLHVDLKIHADLREFFPSMLAAAQDCGDHAQWLSFAKAVNDRYPAALPSYYAKLSPLNPYVFLHELSKTLREGDTIVCGNGTACVVTFQSAIVKKSQRLFTNSGCAAMGYGFPAAIGAATADKDKRIICIDGDGSLQMNLQELQTLVHNKLNVKLFWLNNDGYHSIRQTQTNTFSSNFCGVDGASGISFPSAEKIAAAYGIPYFRIDSLAKLAAVAKRALKTDGPIICEAVLDKTQFFAPKLSSKTNADGTIESPSLENMYPFLTEDELKENLFRQ